MRGVALTERAIDASARAARRENIMARWKRGNRRSFVRREVRRGLRPERLGGGQPGKWNKKAKWPKLSRFRRHSKTFASFSPGASATLARTRAVARRAQAPPRALARRAVGVSYALSVFGTASRPRGSTRLPESRPSKTPPPPPSRKTHSIGSAGTSTTGPVVSRTDNSRRYERPGWWFHASP